MVVSENTKGLILAVASSAFIGSSFILKKKGLKRAGATGARAGVGGYTYLLEPLWWAGMVTSMYYVGLFSCYALQINSHSNKDDPSVNRRMSSLKWLRVIEMVILIFFTTVIVGEIANFVAYVYAPAVLVTPLGALSIIISAILAHLLLKERLQKMGVLGCLSCIVGSVVIVIHAPEEHIPGSVLEIWVLATQPAFLVYIIATLSIVLALILHFEPRCGQTNILVYLGICSFMGSLTVVSIKAIGIAIKLTLEGVSQLTYPQSWFFVSIAVVSVVVQINYLNKALDTFNAAIVSPVYYVMFTTLTITASAIMFKDWADQSASSIASELCGFVTVLSGTVILHSTREQEQPASPQGAVTWYIREESAKSIEEGNLITIYD